ncbi:hypothetical protein PHYSODRAFT_322620 [Phytophthora sojae]|uniref:Uncharacterized protein n=1 Tax=Phytophthora sojae (strain P6497) TaxID=1094619 RepID=G4YGC3_PHYSP|nr:hypothetical protein PHYSODRAFT_322620 [Phytophthora sojae]EGZ29036.1 hypothetical protein PHYSODRAFT_322620 [Phytophthora sojae]|eukprot:XP_009516311.1 hypothetical protein PHYSODRAFT_322620 [Phytophthora sojae]
MTTSAYSSWLNKREFKLPRTRARLVSPADKEKEEGSCKTPEKTQENAAPEASATTRKRPRESDVSKLPALRSLKRRLEETEETPIRKEKRNRGDGSQSNVIAVRTGKHSGHQKQHKQQQKNKKPVLLDESCYWLAVQRFSQL